MYRYLIVILLMFFSLTYASEMIEDSGTMVVKKGDFKDISKFNIKVSIDTTIIKSKSNYYELTADDNIAEIIDIYSNDKSLIVDTKRSFKTNSELKLCIYTTKISELMVDGSIDIKLQDLKEKSLSIIADGVIELSTEGGLSSVKKLNINSEGTIEIDFKNLKSEFTKLNLSGVSNVVLNSVNKPEINLDGVHDIVNLYK